MDGGALSVGGGDDPCRRGEGGAASTIRRWPIWRAGSAIRRCATAAPSAGRLPTTIPAACYPAAVLASGATVVTNRRKIAADDYFQGMFTTALEEGEIITGVNFPIPREGGLCEVQPARRRFALTGVFVAKYPGGVRVAVTGASERRRVPLDRGRDGAVAPTSRPRRWRV